MTEFILNSHFLQRTFVGVDSFRVFQEVYLRTDDPRVVNVVKFSETIGELAVQVTAVSITQYCISFKCLGEYIYRTSMMFCMIFAMRFVTQNIRQKQLSKMGSAFSSVLTEQHSPSSSYHLRFHIRCHSGFLEMKQRVGLTLHTYLAVGTYVFQGETRYILHCLPVTLQPWI